MPDHARQVISDIFAVYHKIPILHITDKVIYLSVITDIADEFHNTFRADWATPHGTWI